MKLSISSIVILVIATSFNSISASSLRLSTEDDVDPLEGAELLEQQLGGDLDISVKMVEKLPSVHRRVQDRQIYSQVGTEWDGKCWDVHTNHHNLYMHKCHSGDNQKFYYTPNNEIKSYWREDLCMDNSGHNAVYMYKCHGGDNQKWKYDVETKTVKSFNDEKCLDYHFNNNDLYMHGCNGGKNQQFNFHSAFFPVIRNLVVKYNSPVVTFESFEKDGCIDETRKLIVLIHGFDSNPGRAFGGLGGTNLLNALVVKYPTACVVRLDWSVMAGKRIGEYKWVQDRVDDAGRALGKYLKNELNINPDNTMMVGHSLGGQLAGNAGLEYGANRIATIIGLDTAGVLYSGIDVYYRLTKGDAKNVIGIHSSDAARWNVGGHCLGWYSEYGDQDIYILTDTPVENDTTTGTQLLGSKWWNCNHDYAIKIYAELLFGESYPFVKKWSWSPDDFGGNFDLDSLGSVEGTITVYDKN